MAEIQSALSAKFMQLVGAHKSGQKGVATEGAQLASFLGVLKSQLTKLDAPDEALALESVLGSALELKVEGAKKPLRAQPDADAALPEAPGAVPADGSMLAPLISDPALQAAAISSAAGALVSAPKDVGTSAQDSEPDSVSPEKGGESELKSVAVSRPEGLLKMGAAAIAADRGQTLPLGAPSELSSRQADASLAPVDVAVEAKPESVVVLAAPLLTGARAEAGAATSGVTSITTAHPFEQVLRQVEAKVNAAIEAPVRSAAFAGELADKVVWLVGRQGQFADLSLNPPQMGALEVRLSMSGSDASAQFFSPNPAVRDAIDAALPKLRELMAQAGINLGEAEVRDQAFGRRENPETQGRLPAQEGEAAANQVALAAIGAARFSGSGLVDLYI